MSKTSVYPAFASFDGKVFENADFRDAEFVEKVTFRNAQFKGKTDFRGAKFNGVGDFTGAQFLGDVDFAGAAFTEPLRFDKIRFAGKTNFAGSALRPIDGIFRAAEMLNCPWQEVWSRFSIVPAQFMGLKTGLEIGKPANLCCFQIGPDNQLADLPRI